ncbi:hypothetical protein G4V62_14160 [Bacillaceae bacterium SIJ1]|uniref:YfkD famly protein n=1 Tax=Litoribacterium kuwaitense TaxID=1398745 RepID=UPI0013EC25F2|nr:YfkD famly protein [Litoribacterium kuwaitense]NGP46037.1 hypothetical protein [Litoribacterium kuwaitense]
MKRIYLLLLAAMLTVPTLAEAKQSDDSRKPGDIPDAALNISKENTYPNSTNDQTYLTPSEEAKELIETAGMDIDNPDLIRLLNETEINMSPLSIGSRAVIFLGEWPLAYQSEETNTNWQYQLVNVNKYDNRGGKDVKKMSYVQEKEKQVSGGLTTNLPHQVTVEKMIQQKASQKTKLPLAFTTMIGKDTKKEQYYNIPVKKLGYLYGYAPAVNEKGHVTYGEVYLNIKGNTPSLEIKNVTQQGIGAWIPVQDYVSFTFMTSDTPRS